MTMLLLLLTLSLRSLVEGQDLVRLLVVTEQTQRGLGDKFLASARAAETARVRFDLVLLAVDHQQEEAAYNDTCGQLGQRRFSGVVDLSWGGWRPVREAAGRNGLPYVRLETANHPFVRAGDDYLRDRDAVDAALIFETEAELDESLYWIIGNSYIRVIVVSLDMEDAFSRLAGMRPSPSYYVAHGSTRTVGRIYHRARQMKLVKRDSRWNMIAQDWNTAAFPFKELQTQVST